MSSRRLFIQFIAMYFLRFLSYMHHETEWNTKVGSLEKLENAEESQLDERLQIQEKSLQMEEINLQKEEKSLHEQINSIPPRKERIRKEKERVRKERLQLRKAKKN